MQPLLQSAVQVLHQGLVQVIMSTLILAVITG